MAIESVVGVSSWLHVLLVNGDGKNENKYLSEAISTRPGVVYSI